MNALTERITNEISTLIEEDRLVLPTMPEMALRVREAAEDPDAGIMDLAKAIRNDAALTARIIKLANSPMFRSPQEIEDLNMALSRLGMKTTANMATGLAMQQMFQATSDIIDKRMRAVWSSSAEIAGICHLICKHYTKLQPDQAALAGLTFQIGVLPILSYAEENSKLLNDSITLDAVIEAAHPHIGQKILSAWEFPMELRDVPIKCKEFDADKGEIDYADIVIVSKLQSWAGTHKTRDIDYANVKAFTRMGLDADIEQSIAEDLSDEMPEALRLFS